MINRRNIRIKVLHTLFEQQLQKENLNLDEAEKCLSQKFDQTIALNASIWHLVTQIADYVLVFANIKASKRLATQEDLNTSTKISGNVILQQLRKNERFSNTLKQFKLASLFEEDLIRTLFLQLQETPQYQAYISTDHRDAQEEKRIIETILNTCILENDIALSFLSQQYISLETDFDMIASWSEKVLFNAQGFSFNKLVSKDKYEFAFDLLRCYFDKKDTVFSIIEPKLENWDADRVAILDLIILHLGVIEMLYFESIPLKVTINEYIDIAKSYSGMQSGQFVNGLLDNVKKELLAENKIHKVDLHKS